MKRPVARKVDGIVAIEPLRMDSHREIDKCIADIERLCVAAAFVDMIIGVHSLETVIRARKIKGVGARHCRYGMRIPFNADVWAIQPVQSVRSLRDVAQCYLHKLSGQRRRVRIVAVLVVPSVLHSGGREWIGIEDQPGPVHCPDAFPGNRWGNNERWRHRRRQHHRRCDHSSGIDRGSADHRTTGSGRYGRCLVCMQRCVEHAVNFPRSGINKYVPRNGKPCRNGRDFPDKPRSIRRINDQFRLGYGQFGIGGATRDVQRGGA